MKSCYVYNVQKTKYYEPVTHARLLNGVMGIVIIIDYCI